ncbi:glycine cleavage system protein GcvH [candidate division WOR-3 bacterium]|nr:glycine cleavage system protein GcvH [candidate division WOR-3 bacterium]TET78389.1 MAG: glycine cleavage system protein GcvH [Candidatus Cloacimonadota bacterium]
MNVPDNLRYTKDHEWVRVEGEFAFEGLTDYAQSQLADIVTFELKPVGSKFKKDEIFGSVEAVKAVVDLYMAVGGEIVEVNEKIMNTPDVVNKDPYGDGWIIKVKMNNADEYNELITPEDYKKLIEEQS